LGADVKVLDKCNLTPAANAAFQAVAASGNDNEIVAISNQAFGED
jgi:hypothetical protein